MNVRIQVLMSTYNGKSFLAEQLDSILKQQGVDLRVLVRDDGSLDSTLSILREYAARDPRIEIIIGQNLGVVGSFFELMKAAGPDFDFYAFADQDDVWLPEKLSASVLKLSKLPASQPRFYFSRLRYVDAELRGLGQSRVPRHIAFESALVENVATGCSVVFDRSLLFAARPGLVVRNCLMHDWWMYLLALGVGNVVYDENSYVLYRQHAANVVGATANPIQIYVTKAKRFWNRGASAVHLSDQARAFRDSYAEQLSDGARGWVEGFLYAKNQPLLRILWALKLPTRRQSRLDSLILRILILLNRY